LIRFDILVAWFSLIFVPGVAGAGYINLHSLPAPWISPESR
jgi:hypothetical protein